MKPETVILAIKLKNIIEPLAVAVFMSLVAMLFGRLIRQFKKQKAQMTDAYEKAFAPIRQKALESTNPKYLHLLYKQVYKIRNTRRRDPIAYKSASDTMKFILERIDSLPKNVQQEYAKQHHQEHMQQQHPHKH